MEKQSLLETVDQNEEDLYQQVVEHLAAGADCNEITKYGESPVIVASNNGRFDVVKLLLDSGADKAQLGWTATHFSVVYGSTNELRSVVKTHRNELESRDCWKRTPYLLAILTGDQSKTSVLLEMGADCEVVGPREKTVFQYAIQNDDVAMLDWLVNNGHDLDVVDKFLTTPLIAAAEEGKIQSAQYLIEKGVDIFQCDHHSQRAIQVASTLEIVRLLVAKGEDINEVSDEMHLQVIGAGQIDQPNVPQDVYEAEKYPLFGHTNPEEVNCSFWIDMIKSGVAAWQARDKYTDDESILDGPVWCYKRFGRTTNILPDGRIIEIAGEHEDWYDSDFCIYNDVTLFEPNGAIRVFCYPEADFPPTDFHSATLVGNRIVIIGSLGYMGSRQVGHTPVYSLDIDTLKISKISTQGEAPGWISDHRTVLSGNELIVSGGEVWIEEDDKGKLAPNASRYALCLETLVWSKK